MKRSEMISDVREILRAHNIDDEIADRHIMFLARTKRNKFLRQREINDRGEERNQFQQSLFMNTELVDVSRIPSILTGKSVLRTVKALPNIVGRDLFKNIDVRTIQLTAPEIEIVSKYRMTAIDYAPAGFIYGYREDDGHLYFWSANPGHLMLTQVIVQVILEDPEEIVSINELTTPLEEYPITGDLWEIVRPEILKELLSSKGIPIDVLNNKAEDAAPTQK